PHVEDLPLRADPREIVFDRDRLGAGLPDQRLDGHLGVAGGRAQRPEVDGLVAIARERAGVRSHEERLELLREALLLLGRGAAPARADRELSDAAQVEVRNDFRLDQRGDLRRIAPVTAVSLRISAITSLDTLLISTSGGTSCE